VFGLLIYSFQIRLDSCKVRSWCTIGPVKLEPRSIQDPLPLRLCSLGQNLGLVLKNDFPRNLGRDIPDLFSHMSSSSTNINQQNCLVIFLDLFEFSSKGNSSTVHGFASPFALWASLKTLSLSGCRSRCSHIVLPPVWCARQ
jgi:hypothetical protein